MSKCGRCGRGLKMEESRQRGYGPVCWGKVQGEGAIQQEMQFANIEVAPTITDGYAGARDKHGNVKVVRIRNGKQYPLRHLVYHSPSGFQWGYGGSGPADLARSILADVIGEQNVDAPLYQSFKWDAVSSWDDRWEISLDEIQTWLRKENDPRQRVKPL